MITGSGAVSVELEDFRWLNTILGNINNALQGTYHLRFGSCTGVSAVTRRQ